MGKTLRGRSEVESLTSPGAAEALLSRRDRVLASLIGNQLDRWPSKPTEDPIWGLIRIVMAQQIATRAACRLADRVKCAYPYLTRPTSGRVPDALCLQKAGLTQRRANCCIAILQRSDEIRANVQQGETWEHALAGIKGIGPWTLAVFRIMVLREPDVLPSGDVGLNRAIANVYGPGIDLVQLAENWRPFRSIACWYLWRTLGNEQLG